MKKSLIVVLILIGVVLLTGGMLVTQRNALVVGDEGINASWAQVDNVMQRRADLIPNLVNTVKGYAKHEKDIFIQVAEARAKLNGAKSISDKISANQQIDGALARLLVIVERYPDLKANQNFLALQDELAGTENRIAVERMRFNEVVRSYNVLVRRFPTNIAAGLFHFTKRDEYFEAAPEAKTVPKVDFN